MPRYADGEVILHPNITQLLYVAAHNPATIEELITEFELDEMRLNDFVAWAKLENFAIINEDSDGNETSILITPDGTKWVLGQVWDFMSGDDTDVE